MSPDFKFWPGKDARYAALGIKDEDIPVSESLKDVTKRTSQFWDEVIVPQLRQKKRICIVGHENNLRSIIKRLDNIPNDVIIDLELPRAIPLYYELDPETLKPVPFLEGGSEDIITGRYLGDPNHHKKIAERDLKQVYDLSIKENLETGEKAISWKTYLGTYFGLDDAKKSASEDNIK